MVTTKSNVIHGGSANALRTPIETAERLGLSNPDTLAVWRSTKRYNLPYVKVGRLVRYRDSDIEAFLQRNTVETGDAA